ncbi:MAG: universal stress protein [Proteobacteria bacterium]|nr:universal stress protein [Pseudomonadota bacterium]
MKDILIHVRDFESRTPAAHFGVRLAAKFGASVTAVYACGEAGYVAPTLRPELMAAIMENMRQLVKDAVQSRQEFVKWAATLGVPQSEWLVAEGDTADALAQAATRHDLLVLDHGDEERGSFWDVPGLILEAGVPCIVVPHHGAHFVPFERVAIGWNGSPEAMRAVHSALPFMQGKQVLLLWGEERGKYQGLEWDPPFNIRAYLEHRGITVEQRMVAAKRDDVGTVLLEEAMRFRADLLVMGAYGRTRFSEWMLGGATRHVLAWSDIPVLLRH